MRKQLKIFAAVFLVGALIVSTFLYCTKKDNIYNATITDLDNVHEIGEVLSNKIYTYVQTNGIQSVDELQGHIPNVGEVRIKELKKIYK
jgi:DNA uptake protein ComE-like DNA-binding protein